MKQKLADQGLTVAGDTPEHFRDFIDSRDQEMGQGDQGRRRPDDEVRGCSGRRYRAALRRCSANCFAGRGSDLKLRAQITSRRLAQGSRIRTTLIGIDRAQRLAAASGITAMPMPAATIWQIASKSFSRARKSQAHAEPGGVSGDMGVQRGRGDQPDEIATRPPRENRPAAGPQVRPARAATSTRRSSLNGIRSIVSGKRVLGGKAKIGRAGRDGVRDVAAFALLDVDRDVRDARARKAASAFGRYSDRPDVLARKRTVALTPLAKRRRDRRASPPHCA